jgi:diguanylate cyclase (GGDEF)-like protein
MNDRMNWLDRQVSTQERDDWVRGGGSWGQTQQAPMAAPSASTESKQAARLAHAARPDSGSALASPAAAAAPVVGLRHQPAPARLPRRGLERSTDVALPMLAADVATVDWDDLFRAVKARLSSLAAASLAAQSSPGQLGQLGQLGDLQAGVRDCVSSLDQLHLTLAHEVDRRRALEIDFSNARAALALLRAQLLGARGVAVPFRPANSTDDLTGLADRASVLERFRQLVTGTGQANCAATLVVVNLDGFASVNDAHGHKTGDALLRIVAARLVRALRFDDLVGRLDGDEFVCMLADVTNRDQLSHLACKLFDSVAAPIRIGALQLAVRPSIGIVTCPADGSDAAAQLKCAALASQRARQQCSGYAFYDPPIAPLPANPGCRAVG